MYERFEELFDEVMEEMDCAWYELFDSEEFGEVERRIVAEFGEEVLSSEEYEAWLEEMSMEL